MSVTEPAVRRWTVAEYHRAAELGIFGPEERLELIQGAIFHMSPQNGPHATASTLTESAVQALFRAGYVIRIQKPLTLGGQSEPEPDIAVVRGKARDYLQAHPTTAELVVEIADSSLQFDREEKAEIYARAGIPDYWIVNVPERLLEVYRDPDPGAGEYRTMTRYDENATVAPLAAPQTRIAVRDLLP